MYKYDVHVALCLIVYVAINIAILNTILTQLIIVMGNAGSQLTTEAGVPFFEGQKVIFIEEQDSFKEQVMGDVGVITEIVMTDDERQESQYLVVWLYRNRKVVRVFDLEEITHEGPVDDCLFSDVKKERYDDDWWERGYKWEPRPSGIHWDSFVDHHTGNQFARGDCVLIEPNFCKSQYHRFMVDVNVGDKCILLEYFYEPNECLGDMQKHYFRMYSCTKMENVRVLEGSFCHTKFDFRKKIDDVPDKFW